jgi:dCMP deaminase
VEQEHALVDVVALRRAWKVEDRPTIIQTLAVVARAWGGRSTCSRRQVGAVIADHKGVIISSGYNGAPAGMDHCDHSCDCQGGNFQGHYSECNSFRSCTLAIHAEENAILFAARRGISTYGSMIVTTYGPCYRCARMIVQAGIDMVVYLERNPDPQALDLFNRTGMTLLSASPKE